MKYIYLLGTEIKCSEAFPHSLTWSRDIASVKQDSSCQYSISTGGHASLIHLWKLGEDRDSANNPKSTTLSRPPARTLSLIPCSVSPHFDPQPPSPVPLELEMFFPSLLRKHLPSVISPLPFVQLSPIVPFYTIKQQDQGLKGGNQPSERQLVVNLAR